MIRLPWLWRLVIMAGLALPGCLGTAHSADRPSLTVMTMNMFTGTNFEELVAVQGMDLGALRAAVAVTVKKIVDSDPAERAAAMAAEIARQAPELVGLQEASILTLLPASGPPVVEEDLVQALLNALQARGMHYGIVAVETGLDIIAPSLVDNVRLTTRDVIIARLDLPAGKLAVSNAQHGDYVARPTFRTALGLISDPSGWASVDVQVDGGDHLHFVTTHLDVNPDIAYKQAQELVAVLGQTTLPTVLVCDCNSAADIAIDQTFATYQVMQSAGFKDTFRVLYPDRPGFTCCQDENLLNRTSKLFVRIDLVQFRGAFTPKQATVVGNTPRDKTASGLWPSDHAAVAATLRIGIEPDED
jgi:endonuclease/exonuclease/phosphatase family metal-dependent hydrolase